MAEIRKRGVHAAVVCSDAFMHLGKTQAKVWGVPDLALIEIKHPLGGLSPEQVEGRAHHAITQLITVFKECTK